VIAGGALLASMVPAAFAWDGGPVSTGRPNLTDNSPLGYYVWHNDDGYHVRTHGPGAEHWFVARLHTGGVFDNVNPVRLESDDTVQVVDGGHGLVLRFHTYDGIDGADFRIRGGEALWLNLELDGQPISTENIFLGDDGAHPRHDPFTFNR
jgi:hypothetical protein